MRHVYVLPSNLLLCSAYLYLFPAQRGDEIGAANVNDDYNHQPDVSTPAPSLNCNHAKPTHKALLPAHYNFMAESQV
jgi:hypothetical protein